MVMVAGVMAVLLLLATFTIDVGNWFMHKRHLQMQADASALATAQDISIACAGATKDNARITERASQYAGFDSTLGDSYNEQVADRQGSVSIAVNSSTWPEQPDRVDDTVDTRPPCSSSMVDVKLTEHDLPFFFRVVNGAVPGGDVVPAINAHARISVLRLDSRKGFLPVAVPQAAPTAVRATFIDESTGATLGQADLRPNGVSPDGLALWDNAGVPESVTMPNSSRVGVRIALGEGSSVTCGQPLVTCFDAGSDNGLLHARAYPTSGGVSLNGPPRARSVALLPGGSSCARPTFVASASSCALGLRATVDFGSTTPVADRSASVTATVNGSDVALTHDAASNTWVTASGIQIAAGAGPVDVSLKWEAQKGSNGTDTCTNKNSNPCKGSFGVVQRVMSATDARTGPIRLGALDTATGSDQNSFPQGSVQQLVVRIGITGNLAAAQTVGDPVVKLRVAGNGSQNQSLDCDPDISNLRNEIKEGCFPLYTRNTSGSCPSSPTSLWASPQPWSCVAIQTGGAVGQVSQGLNDRINDGASVCKNPSRWSQYPNVSPSDPRIVPLMLTPYNTFQGSGTTTVPVQAFATFYITGWGGSPCPGDDAAESGFISGHFIKYVQSFADDTTTGAQACNFSTLDPCYARMTE